MMGSLQGCIDILTKSMCCARRLSRVGNGSYNEIMEPCTDTVLTVSYIVLKGIPRHAETTYLQHIAHSTSFKVLNLIHCKVFTQLQLGI